MPKYSVSIILDGFKVYVKNICIVKLNWEPELWMETRNIIRDECEKTMPEVKKKEKMRHIIEETLKIVKDRWEAKFKGDKSRIRTLNSCSMTIM